MTLEAKKDWKIIEVHIGGQYSAEQSLYIGSGIKNFKKRQTFKNNQSLML